MALERAAVLLFATFPSWGRTTQVPEHSFPEERGKAAVTALDVSTQERRRGRVVFFLTLFRT